MDNACFAALPVPVVIVDGSTLRVLEANGACLNMTGWQCRDGASIISLLPPNSGLEHFLRATVETCLEGKGSGPLALALKKTYPLRWEDGAGAGFAAELTLFYLERLADGAVRLYISLEPDVSVLNASLRRYFDNYPEMLFLKDTGGRIALGNERFAELCATAPEGLRGRRIKDLGLPTDLADYIDSACERSRTTGQAIIKHQWFDSGKGESLCYRLHTFPDIDDRGETCGVFGFMRDITAVRKVERALREQSDLLQAANDAALVLFSDEEDLNDLIWLALRVAGRAAGADCVGVWRNHSVGGNALLCTLVYSWFHDAWPLAPERLDGTFSYAADLPGWEEALSQGESVGMATPAGEKALSFFQARGFNSLLAVPILTRSAFWGFICLASRSASSAWGVGEENLLRSVGMLLASSVQRRVMQKALSESEARFRDVAEAAGEIVWELNAAGKFSYISERIAALSGFTPQELAGASWDDISLDDESEPVSSRMFQAGMNEGGFRAFRHRIVAKTGKALWLSSSGKLLTSAEGIAGLRGVSLDITLDKKNSEDLISAMKALEQANTDLSVSARQAHELAKKAEEANQAKSDFLANISHEIRTPLNAIIGMSYLIQKTDLSDLQKDYADKIHSGGMALLGVVDEVLDFAKIESGNLGIEQEPFSLEDVMNLLASVVGEKVEKKGLDAAFIIDRDVPVHLVGDSVRLGQILMNLTGNAVKFTEKGGFSLRCSLELMEPGSVSLRFVVADTGIGIDSERRRELFEPFWQAEPSTTRRYGGTGLGLAIVRKLVDLKGGSLFLDSEPGQGTTVSVLLSFILDSRPGGTGATGGTGDIGEAQTTGERDLGGVQAVVMDPSDLQRSYISDILRQAGCKVNAVDNKATAFAALQGSDDSGGAPRLFILPLEEAEQNRDLKHLDEMRLHAMPHVICITPFGLGKTTEELSKSLDYAIAGQASRPVTTPALTRAVRLALGRAVADAGAPDDASALAAPYFPGSRILLVEDNPVNQQIAQELLRETGAVVTLANNGSEAQVFFDNSPENPFDLVFMDLQMPVMDGFEATRAIRANPALAGLPIIAMTAHATVEERERTLSSGMNEHISKPIDVAVLYDTLRRWLKAPDIVTAQGAESGPAQERNDLDTHGLLAQLSELTQLLAEDDAASCRLFGQVKAQLEAVDSHATSLAAQALAEFDFAEALAALRPMETGLKNALGDKA